MRALGIILAGGNSNKLGDLSAKRAVAAMPITGSYRAIDFALSNMTNSHIQKVAVFTQYNTRSLNEHLNSSKWWDFGRKQGGLFIFTPTITAANSYWYKGTADALYQNIKFLKESHEPYVVIASGDGIYKLDYNKVLEEHISNGADITVVCKDMAPGEDDINRFGVIKMNEDGRIIDFEEKPKNPRSTLASMGIYIFTWKKLKAYLIANENDKEASKDFGKNIIPDMREAGEKLVAYRFDGYWKDVGTIDSLWEANMDLINPNIPIDLYDTSWKIYSRNPVMPPQSIGKNAQVQNSMVTEGCVIDGSVEFSMISDGVTVEEGAEILDSILMPGAVVKKGAKVEYAIVGENTVIGENAQIGARPETIEDKDSWGVAVVGNNLTVSDGSVVAPKAIIYENI